MAKCEESVADLNRALGIEQNNAEALKRRGRIYLIMGKYGDSISDLSKSLEIEKK